jgi:hypothetical protein
VKKGGGTIDQAEVSIWGMVPRERESKANSAYNINPEEKKRDGGDIGPNMHESQRAIGWQESKIEEVLSQHKSYDQAVKGPP